MHRSRTRKALALALLLGAWASAQPSAPSTPEEIAAAQAVAAEGIAQPSLFLFPAAMEWSPAELEFGIGPLIAADDCGAVASGLLTAIADGVLDAYAQELSEVLVGTVFMGPTTESECVVRALTAAVDSDLPEAADAVAITLSKVLGGCYALETGQAYLQALTVGQGPAFAEALALATIPSGCKGVFFAVASAEQLALDNDLYPEFQASVGENAETFKNCEAQAPLCLEDFVPNPVGVPQPITFHVPEGAVLPDPDAPASAAADLDLPDTVVTLVGPATTTLADSSAPSVEGLEIDLIDLSELGPVTFVVAAYQAQQAAMLRELEPDASAAPGASPGAAGLLDDLPPAASAPELALVPAPESAEDVIALAPAPVGRRMLLIA